MRVRPAKSGHIAVIEKFVWNPAGYKKMQWQPAIQAFMKAKAELLEREMKRLTTGPQRSPEDYREHSRFSNAYNIGTSTQFTLRDSIKVKGPQSTGAIDTPFSFNVGVYDYNPLDGGSADDVLNALRFGRTTDRMQGRDFIKDAIRNSLGSDLDT